MSDLTNKKKIPILMYHSISEQASKKYKTFAISPNLFAEHLAYLNDQGYTPLTVSEFIDKKSEGFAGLPARPVLLTFDDGFADFYEGALPALRKYDFKATLYIVTKYIGDTGRWLVREGEGNRPMLSWEQVLEINAAGIECGGHTHTHPQLDTIPHAQVREEVSLCKTILEDKLNHEVRSFAYPFGYHTAAIKEIVRESGYSSACAVRYEMSLEDTDQFALTRLQADPSTSVARLEALLTSGTPSLFVEAYKRARVPLWRLARRCSAPVAKRIAV